MKTEEAYEYIKSKHEGEIDDFKLAVQLYEVEKFRESFIESLASIEPLIEHVCAVLGVTKSSLVSKKQHRKVAEARQVIWWLLHNKITPNTLTLMTLGKLFKRDHATVIHSISKINDIVTVDGEFRDRLIMMVNHFKRTTSWDAEKKTLTII